MAPKEMPAIHGGRRLAGLEAWGVIRLSPSLASRFCAAIPGGDFMLRGLSPRGRRAIGAGEAVPSGPPPEIAQVVFGRTSLTIFLRARAASVPPAPAPSAGARSGGTDRCSY